MKEDNASVKWAETLRAIRSELQPELNTSILGELDSVIEQIEEAVVSRSRRQHRQAVERALCMMARLIEIVTNVANLIDKIPN